MACMYGNEYHKFMANISIVKLKVRRGSDAQRETIVLDQGEIGYTLDTRRLFVGDGSTFGGQSVSNKNIGPFSNNSSLGPDSSPGLQVGDIGYADSRLYMLTSTNYNDSLSGYSYIGNVPDGTLVKFDANNKLTLNTSQFDSTFFKSEFFGSGLLSSTGGIVEVNLNSTYFELSNSKISPVAASITEREIATTALSSGLVGGNNTPLKLKINHDQFEFDVDNNLTFKGVGNTEISAESWAGTAGTNLVNSGLEIDPITRKLKANIRSVNVSNFTLTDGQLNSAGADASDAQAIEFPRITTTGGLVKSITTSIFDVVTGLALSGTEGANSSIPVGTILPHARAFTNSVPNGFLLANGRTLSQAEYPDLFSVIDTTYGNGDGTGDTFSLPNLTGGGMPAVLYGAGAEAPIAGDFSGSQKFLTGNSSATDAILSGFGVNFIIKYKEDAFTNIFNGAPDAVSINAVGRNNNQVYRGVDSNGEQISLSSAGFITFALSGDVRNDESQGSFDKYAIPIFNY
jgi:hypothetical protein